MNTSLLTLKYDKGNARREGFTIIELLVVVAIIAVLVAILLPAIKNAREKAKTVLCQTNEKQLFLIVSMFLDANNGVFATYPWNGFWGDHNISAGGKVAEFMKWRQPSGYYMAFEYDGSTSGKYISAFQCPGTNGYYGPKGQGGYGINGVATSLEIAYVSSSVIYGPAPGGRLSSIRNPDKCFLWGDVVRNNPPDDWSENWGCFPRDWYFSNRHSNGSNVIRWDGSIRFYLPDEIMDFGPFYRIMQVFGAGLD